MVNLNTINIYELALQPDEPGVCSFAAIRPSNIMKGATFYVDAEIDLNYYIDQLGMNCS